jgi:hypothetical protein
MNPNIGNIGPAISTDASGAGSFEAQPGPAFSTDSSNAAPAPVRPLSRVDIKSISIPEGHSALLTQDGGAILMPDGFILGIVDGSLVLMEHKAANKIGVAANV